MKKNLVTFMFAFATAGVGNITDSVCGRN